MRSAITVVHLGAPSIKDRRRDFYPTFAVGLIPCFFDRSGSASLSLLVHAQPGLLRHVSLIFVEAKMPRFRLVHASFDVARMGSCVRGPCANFACKLYDIP